MKKLIFLFILAVAFVGFMPAQETPYPPGALTPEAALSGYAADNRAVTPDTVLVEVSETPQYVIDLYSRAAQRLNRAYLATTAANVYDKRLSRLISVAEHYKQGMLTEYEMQRLMAAGVESMLIRQYVFRDYILSVSLDYPLRL